MYAQFTQTTPDGLDVAKVTELQTLQPCGDFLFCPVVTKATEPSSKFICLLDRDHGLHVAFKLQIVNCRRSLTSQWFHLSHLAPVPPDAPNDVDLIRGPLVGAILVIIRDDAHAGWIAHRDELQSLCHEPHAVMQNEDAWWVWAALRHVDQDNVAIVQSWDHAVALDGHDGQQGGRGLLAFSDPCAAEVKIPPNLIRGGRGILDHLLR